MYTNSRCRRRRSNAPTRRRHASRRGASARRCSLRGSRCCRSTAYPGDTRHGWCRGSPGSRSGRDRGAPGSTRRKSGVVNTDRHLPPFGETAAMFGPVASGVTSQPLLDAERSRMLPARWPIALPARLKSHGLMGPVSGRPSNRRPGPGVQQPPGRPGIHKRGTHPRSNPIGCDRNRSDASPFHLRKAYPAPQNRAHATNPMASQTPAAIA
jgi:hypothetical protein